MNLVAGQRLAQASEVGNYDTVHVSMAARPPIDPMERHWDAFAEV